MEKESGLFNQVYAILIELADDTELQRMGYDAMRRLALRSLQPLHGIIIQVMSTFLDEGSLQKTKNQQLWRSFVNHGAKWLDKKKRGTERAR